MKRKKGFTLVELIVVIVIIAILSAVLIPTLTSVIARANKAADIQLVKNLNTVLSLDINQDLKDHSTMFDALKTAESAGISVDKVKNNKTRNHIIAWDSQLDQFVLIDTINDKCVYPSNNNDEQGIITLKYQYFAIYDEIPTEQTYSIYATDSLTGDNGEVNLTVGFDQGSNVRINSLIFDRSTADSSRQVIIRTNNGTTCEFNGYEGVSGSDTIYHYGESGNQTISVGQHSFCEYGAATEVEVKKGHYVQETGSIVAIVNANADYGDVIIDFKTGSIQGTVKNTNETNSVLINYDNNVTNVNFEGKINGGNLEVNFSSQPTYVNVCNMVQEKDSDKPEVKISGLNNAIKSIPSYDDVGEENAECISVAGYSIKVYTNCNAYSYSETMVDKNIVKENTYTIKFDGNGDSITFNSSDDHIHTFGGPSWTWDGYQTAAATFVCAAKDCNYSEKIVVPTKAGYITNEITKHATCCETGERTYTAHLSHHNEQFANVSPNKEIIDIDFNAHDIVHHDAKAATCTDIGWKSYVTCSRCNYTTYAEIQILGHNYLGEVTPSTCIEQGYTTHICTRCGDSYIDTYVDALGHSFGEWQKVTDSTCLGEGNESRTCIHCGLVETRSTSVLGHTPSAKVFENTIDPTCTDKGSHDEVIYCSVCNSELERIHVVDNALGHDLKHHDGKEPTCIDIGWESYETCSRCYYTTYVELPALEHNYQFECFIWSEDYHTAQARYICSKDANHVTSYDATVTSTIKVPATCETMGTTTYTATYDNHEESQDVVDIHPINHNFGEVEYFWNHDNSQLSATRICLNNANHIETETVNSTSEITLQPTCTTTGIRTFTSNSFENPAFSVHHTTEVIQAEGHNPGSIVVENQVDSTCIGVGHYDNVTYCTRCNTELSRQSITTDALGHEYNVVVVDPTCTEQGYTTHICTRCGDSYVDTYVDALGHDFVNGICTSCGESNISIKFENTYKYLYRVGNNNSVATSSLFEGDISNIVITNIQGNADGSYIDGNINFIGTGVVKITANGSVELLLEVVDGYNVISYSELQNRNSVLLNDITMSNSGKYYLSNATLYGNGFTFDVKNAAYAGTGGESNNYVIGLNNSILDNVQIIGKVYTDYGGTTSADWNYPCVLVNGGNCVIVNSYIANCASPIRARGGANLILKNTTLKGGSFCNLDIRSGAAVTADGLTTINQAEGNDAADNGTVIVGLGIVFWYDGVGGNEKLTIKGDGLTQYNFVANNQKSHTVSTAQTVFEIVFSINSSNIKTIDNVKWVNTGILLLSRQINQNNVTMPNGYSWQNVSLLGQNGYLCTQLASSFPSLPATPTDYSAEAQYPIAPTYSIEYPSAVGKKNYLAKTEDSKNYCYYDSAQGAILIGFEKGDSFSFDPRILTVTKNDASITPVITMNGQTYTDTIPFTEAGEYTITYTYTDPYNYGADGEKSQSVEYTKTINIIAVAADKTIEPATFDFNGKGYKQVTGTNSVTYVMPNIDDSAVDGLNYVKKTVGGQTVYYPVVCVRSGSPSTTTSINGNALSKSATNTALLMVFDGIISITDNGKTYEADNTNMADGKLSAINGLNCLVWSSANAYDTEPDVVSKIQCFKSASIQGVNRDQSASDVEYSYTDDAGNTYHYFVKYVFPAKGTGVNKYYQDNATFTVTVSCGANGTVDNTTIKGVKYGTALTSDLNKLMNGTKVIATATPNEKYAAKWSNLSSSVTKDTTVTLSFVKECTLTINCGEGGTVNTQTITGIAEGAKLTVDGNKLMVNGAVVATATPASGGIANWSIPNTTVSDDMTIDLTFVTPVTITITAGSNGSVSPTSVKVAPGGKLTASGTELKYNGVTIATAAPDSKYAVDKWSIPTTAITADIVVSVSFKSSGGGSCVAKGTLITMADGTQKKIEDLEANDMIIAFNHETGEYEETPIFMVVNHGTDNYSIMNLQFEDGTNLEMIESHGLFDFNLNQYVDFTEENYSDYVGHYFAKYSDNGTTMAVKLGNVEIYSKETDMMAVFSFGNLNAITNGFVSYDTKLFGTYNYFEYDENMKYIASSMEQDIANYGVYDYEHWAEYIPFETYDAFNFKYFKVAVEKGLCSESDIVGYILWLGELLEEGSIPVSNYVK